MSTSTVAESKEALRGKLNSREIWSKAFFSVISAYQETKTVIGTSGAIDYSKALLNPSTSLQVVGHIKPSLLDFICDVELTARKALNDEDFKFFQTYFVHTYLEDFPNNERLREQAQSIAHNVGRKLITNKIHPVKGYMQGKMVKVNRGGE